MTRLQRYKRRAHGFVTAVQIKLDTTGLRYRKWGGRQIAKRGDWLVDNEGEVYSIDAASFRRTYRKVSPGVFTKTARVWARVAEVSGSLQTKEGSTRYRKGDVLVFNDADATDGYAMSSAKFRALYVRDRTHT